MIRSALNDFGKNRHCQNTFFSQNLFIIAPSLIEVPVDFAKKVNSITIPFIWPLTGLISEGGLNMTDFVDVEKSPKATWVNRYRSSENSD